MAQLPVVQGPLEACDDDSTSIETIFDESLNHKHDAAYNSKDPVLDDAHSLMIL